MDWGDVLVAAARSTRRPSTQLAKQIRLVIRRYQKRRREAARTLQQAEEVDIFALLKPALSCYQLSYINKPCMVLASKTPDALHQTMRVPFSPYRPSLLQPAQQIPIQVNRSLPST